jgi:hypothetical protein
MIAYLASTTFTILPPLAKSTFYLIKCFNLKL